MKRISVLFMITGIFMLSACDYMPVVHFKPKQPPVLKVINPIEAIGYSSMSHYKNYPKEQQQLLAIRAAKLDAYRNLAEELYGVRIKGNTTVKDMIIENDNYRVYINGVLRGAHLQSVSPKGNGVYEAEVVLNFNDYMNNCIYNPHMACFNTAVNQGVNSGVYPTVYPEVMVSQ